MSFSSFNYLLAEGFKNVFKNKKSTSAALFAMCATMILFGLLFAVGENLNNIMVQIETQQGMQVYLKDEATEEQVEQIGKDIKAIDGVNKVEFVSKADALNQMKEKFKEKQNLLAGYEEDNPFPASYIVTLTNLEKNENVQSTISNMDNIQEITTRNDTISALMGISKAIKIASIGIIAVLIVVSVFIISNTIKLSVHSRRREISIMKYVGATNKFIRCPFVIEGIVIGMISVLISILCVGLLYNFVIDKLTSSSFMTLINITILEFSQMFKTILIVYAILGIGLGMIGSGLSMKKYLDV